MPTLAIPVVAIDVGYFATKYTLGTAGKEIQCGCFPSVAPRAVADTSRFSAFGPSLDIVQVEVGGSSYFVGPDAMLRKSGRTPRVVLESFASRPEHAALLQGALYQVARHHLIGKHETSHMEISELVLGLPLNTLREFAEPLKELATRTHVLPSLHRSGQPLQVTVKRTTVIAQPHGSVVFNTITRQLTSAQHWLVLDLGGGTFDWFLTYGPKVLTDMCGAHPRGMLAAVNAVADAIKPGMRDDPIMVERIDTALRTNAGFINVIGQPVSLEPFMSLVEGVINESLDKMLEVVDGMSAFDAVLVTGGGAHLLRQQLIKRVPEVAGVVLINEDPVFSNVRGFHMVGQQLANARVKVAA